MKSEIYNALASLNRSLDLAFESLKALQEQGVITADFANDNSVRLNKVWADMNYMIVHKRSSFELEDRDHYGQMLETLTNSCGVSKPFQGLQQRTSPKVPNVSDFVNTHLKEPREIRSMLDSRYDE